MRCPFRNFLHFLKRHWTLSAIAAIVFLCGSLLADTTWVAGDVYGVWDTSGSPFMVTDTITVPLDSTLEIRPGVEIWFQDQEIRRTPFNVHGRLLAFGVEGDSIYFYSPISGFGGISNQYTPGTEIRMEYCVIDSLHECIRSEEGLFVAKHCRIHGYRQESFSTLIACGASIDTVQYCALFGGLIRFSRGGPSVFQHNQAWAFIPTWQQMAPIFGNQLHMLFLDDSPWMEVYDNELEGLQIVWGSAYIHDNIIQGSFGVQESEVTFENNVVEGIGIYESQGTFRGNVIHRDYLGNYGINLNQSNSVTIERNLVLSARWGIWIMGGDYNLILNNTVTFGDKGVYSSYTGDHNQIVNNIFVGDGVSCTGVYSAGQDSFLIRYNDFHQVNTVTYECELDTGNIFVDPLFRGGDPFDYQLQANSPCIDAGDPNSPLDPDSTRADMGAYY